MNEEFDIHQLVHKYEELRESGQAFYFDADEFALLANYYNSYGDDAEAENIIRVGLQMHPESLELLILNAKVMVYSEKYEEANQYLSTITDEENIDLELLKIECKLHLGDFDSADVMVQQTLLNIEDDEDDLYFFITELGFLYNDVDLFEEAIRFLEQSFALERVNPEVLIDLAYAYEMEGNFLKAIDYNNLLLDIDPYSFEGWLNLGKLYSMTEQYDKAIDSFDFALTINENDIGAMKMKALSLYFNDNVKEAIRIFEECLSLSPDDASLYDSLLEAYEAMEQHDEMFKIIDRKVEKFGESGATLNRARAHLSKGDFEQAKALFAQIPLEEHESLAYYLLEGEIAFYSDDFRTSEAAYIKASLLSPENEEIIDRLANVNVAQEKYEQAAEYLEQLLELEPTFPTAKARLAFIRFEIGTKAPFDEIMQQFSDDGLQDLLNLVNSAQNVDYSKFSREQILMRLHEARENRVLFKNIKY